MSLYAVPSSASRRPSECTLLNADTMSFPSIVACVCGYLLVRSAILVVSLIASIAERPLGLPYCRWWKSAVMSCSASAISFLASLPTQLDRTMRLHPLTCPWSLFGLGIMTICSSLHAGGVGWPPSTVKAMSLMRFLPSGVSLMIFRSR